MYQTKQNNEATEEMAQRQQDQINDAAAEKTNARMEEARAMRASFRASAAESAVSGNSVSILANDIMGQAGRDVALIDKNRRNGIVASGEESRARIRSNNAEALGGIAQAGMTAYGNVADYKRLSIPKGE
ncbi:virion core protein, T7 gp14 family [Stenotrophomonas pavanii]|uniref:virion core protein, T7 gp14 family n=1 Tax=Stenotrophomonas pavanii TaxID=487698 RepID=UPI00404107B2